MEEIQIEKVMDRKKIADTINAVLDEGVVLLKKNKLDKDDYGKIKILRTLSSHVNAAISMVQQETSQLRSLIVLERMKQLGYDVPKYLTG